MASLICYTLCRQSCSALQQSANNSCTISARSTILHLPVMSLRCCDNKAVIAHVNQTRRKFSQRRICHNVNIIAHITGCMDSSTLRTCLNWVKAHQDKMKLYTNLDIWGWMNCDTDQIANNFCLQMESGEVRPIQEGFFESSANVSLIVNAVCLHIQWSKQEKFLQDKHGWSDKAWNSINWKDFKGAFLSLGPLKCKSIHSWLNTGRRKSKISPDVIDAYHCPRCLQRTENQEHILNCLNPCAHKCQYVGSQIWNHLHWILAKYPSNNKICLYGPWQNRIWLGGILECGDIQASIGVLQVWLIHVLIQRMTRVRLGLDGQSWSCGAWHMRCGSIIMQFYTMQYSRHLRGSAMRISMMKSWSYMTKWTLLWLRTGGTLICLLPYDWRNLFVLDDDGWSMHECWQPSRTNVSLLVRCHWLLTIPIWRALGWWWIQCWDLALPQLPTLYNLL